jgi:hypothetical protein
MIIAKKKDKTVFYDSYIHCKVYRQIQDRPKINAGDIVQHRKNIRTVQHPGKDADVIG